MEPRVLTPYVRQSHPPRFSLPMWATLLVREATVVTLKRLREEKAARTLDRVFPPLPVLFAGAYKGPHQQTRSGRR